MAAPRPTGSIDIWNFVDNVTGTTVRKWIRDSWARKKIVALQQAVSSIVVPTKTSDLTNDSDFQTGTQVGNAISAEAGMMVPYGYCTTAAATVAKVVTVSPAVTELTTGLTIAVKYQYANTGSNPTLNVNSLGAKAIKRYGTTAAGTSAAANWNANSVVMLTYDGTYWMLVDWNNTTYSGMSDAEYQAGTGTSNRLITPARLKAAIELHAPVQSVNGQDGDVTVNVPTKTSDLTNDSGFITSAPVTSVNTKTGAVTLNASDVGALPSSTVIPSATSDLTNDSGFITASSVPSASSTAPAMDGTASAGASADYARADHVHPADTSKQDALTSAQLAAVNSGITSEKVATYDAIKTIFEKPTALPSGADLNTYKTPGHYGAFTGAIARSILNCPTTSNFTLLVIYRTDAHFSQIIVSSNANLFHRYNTSGGWSSWYQLTGTAV